VPGVAEVGVVVGDGALVKRVGQWRIEGQRRALAGVGHLGGGYDAQGRGCHTGCLGSRRISGSDKSRHVEVCNAASSTLTELVGGGKVDAAAIVRALMEVEVVLVLTAELEQMVALEQGQIVAQEVVMAVPETGTDVLRI